MKYALTETKLGWVPIGIEDGAICAAALPASRNQARATLAGWGVDEAASKAEAAPLIDLVQRAAAGEAVKTDGMVRLVTGTPFQRAVYEELLKIPKGHTVSYAEVARRVGRPGAARAVGQAVGANPIPLLIPCHRVLASDGSLGGFGGGLPLKTTLLKQEGVSV